MQTFDPVYHFTIVASLETEAFVLRKGAPRFEWRGAQFNFMSFSEFVLGYIQFGYIYCAFYTPNNTTTYFNTHQILLPPLPRTPSALPHPLPTQLPTRKYNFNEFLRNFQTSDVLCVHNIFCTFCIKGNWTDDSKHIIIRRTPLRTLLWTIWLV